MRKIPIPELPETTKELEDLLKKRFKVLKESKPVVAHGKERRYGSITITNLTAECPFCGMQFEATRRNDCSTIIPNTCPNCDFPVNVIYALWGKK